MWSAGAKISWTSWKRSRAIPNGLASGLVHGAPGVQHQPADVPGKGLYLGRTGYPIPWLPQKNSQDSAVVPSPPRQGKVRTVAAVRPGGLLPIHAGTDGPAGLRAGHGLRTVDHEPVDGISQVFGAGARFPQGNAWSQHQDQGNPAVVPSGPSWRLHHGGHRDSMLCIHSSAPVHSGVRYAQPGQQARLRKFRIQYR